jgi:RNA polymerase-binding transcription factor DksA
MNTDNIKERLLKEKSRVLSMLANVAKKNPNISGDFDPVEPELNIDQADESDVAEAIEGFQENVLTTDSLEGELLEINQSLKDLEDGKYGICRVCGQKIEDDRLSVIVYAQTCKKHMA